MVEKHGSGKIYSSRLSNGHIELLNRKVKDLKRLGHGYRNFEHFRTRFLYATRDNSCYKSIIQLLTLIWKIKFTFRCTADQAGRKTCLITSLLFNFSLPLRNDPKKLNHFQRLSPLIDPKKLGETPLNFGDPRLLLYFLFQIMQ